MLSTENRMTKCSVCGKVFLRAYQHMYKRETLKNGWITEYQCSYSHYVQAGGDGGPSHTQKLKQYNGR